MNLKKEGDEEKESVNKKRGREEEVEKVRRGMRKLK